MVVRLPPKPFTGVRLLGQVPSGAWLVRLQPPRPNDGKRLRKGLFDGYPRYPERSRIADNPPSGNGEDEHGERYESKLVMVGSDGKQASVLAGWIRRPGESIMRLTTIFVTMEVR